MRASLATRWLAVPLAALCLPIAAGCDPVREDRAIQFTNSGDRVAFQHGSDGIFVADPKSGELRKVFDPDPSIVAASTPVWSPDESFAIFSTARDEHSVGASPGSPPAKGGSSMPAAWEEAPQGRLFFAQSIVYTCWMVKRAADGKFDKPSSLFEAHCNHAGYVAANLAVRLSPRRTAVLYIDRTLSGGHAVWLYDWTAKSKQRVFPLADHLSPAHVVADFVPETDQIVCTATSFRNEGGTRTDAKSRSHSPDDPDGIWIGRPGNADWWHVGESIDQSSGGSQGFSGLMGRRPAFNKDGRMLAFLRATQRDAKTRTALFRGRLGSRTVEKVFEAAGDISDLHWSPDGLKLGFVGGEPTPVLTAVDAKGMVLHPIQKRMVRHFAGWNVAGDTLAYVTPAKEPPKSADTWALLLMPDPLARDSLMIADAKGQSRTVASGLRFTFPQWSPKRDQLSAWGTFAPTHRLAAADGMLDLAFGLRRGDPAAVIDASTGEIHWLAINGDEEAQVGHYFLLAHDFAQARDWYRKAEKRLAPLKPLRPADLFQGLSGEGSRRRTFELFYSYCLNKLGESNEAVARLKSFEDSHRIEWPPIAMPDAKSVEDKTAAPTNDPAAVWAKPESRREAERLVSILKCLTIAQVNLSLEDADAARAFFKRRLDEGDTADRLGSLMAVSQLSLLQRSNREFVDLATDRLAPLLISAFDDRPADWTNTPLAARSPAYPLILFIAGHAIGPLFCEAFLMEFPADVVASLIPKWTLLREQCRGPGATLGADLVLRAASARLGNKEQKAVEENRIAKNPARGQLLPSGGIEAYFALLRNLALSARGGGT